MSASEHGRRETSSDALIRILKGAEADVPRRPRMYWTLAPSGVAEARSVPLFTGYAFVPLKIGPQSHATPARRPRDAREAPVRLPLAHRDTATGPQTGPPVCPTWR